MLSTRIDTDGAGNFCGGHSNATGLRAYFDATTRQAKFSMGLVTPLAYAPKSLLFPVMFNMPALPKIKADYQGQNSTVTIAYEYDPLYRLTSADYSTGDYYHYAYDSVGNRLSETTALATKSYIYDDANRLSSVDGVNYTFDANGNLLNDGQNSYVYDSANRLISVNSTDSFTYNGMGDRLTQNNTQYVLDLNAGLTQVLDDGTSQYVYGLGRISQTNTSTEYFLGDALGSVRQLTNANAEITLSKSYDPYGVVTQTSGPAHTDYGFTGENYSDSTELIYLRARFYNPADGRFQSRDTWLGEINQPLSLNHWNYVEGNPANRIDPSGHWYCTGTINCEDWVENALENLRKLDGQIVSDFERYDQNLTVAQKIYKVITTGIDPLNPPNWSECSFIDVGYRFAFMDMKVFGAITRPTHIDIDNSFINPNKPTTVALLGHELYHLLRQSFSVATTIYGELLAAQYEAYLVRLQGVALPSHLLPPNYSPVSGVGDMDPNYGPDLLAYRDFTPYPWYEPLYPLGVKVVWPSPDIPECIVVSSGQPLACIAPTAPSLPLSTPQP